MMTGSKAEVESYETSASEHDGMFIASLVQTPAASADTPSSLDDSFKDDSGLSKNKKRRANKVLESTPKKQKGDNN